ncbi:Magnesium transporter [Nymphaea thermarum]|nr:Magnesium transporter [Nymphaea thermarum]
MPERVLVFDHNRIGGKNFLESLLPRLNPKNVNGAPSMPFELEVVEAALVSRIQRLEQRLMDVEPRVRAEAGKPVTSARQRGTGEGRAEGGRHGHLGETTASPASNSCNINKEKESSLVACRCQVSRPPQGGGRLLAFFFLQVVELLEILPNRLTVDALEQLRVSKQKLVDVGSRAGDLKQMLLDLLEDPHEIRRICIMGRKCTIRKENNNVECSLSVDKQIAEGFSLVSFSVMAEEEEEIEMLLENYLQSVKAGMMDFQGLDDQGLRFPSSIIESCYEQQTQGMGNGRASLSLEEGGAGMEEGSCFLFLRDIFHENFPCRCESCHGQAERLLDSAKEMEDSIAVNLSSRRLEVSRVELLLQVGTFCIAVGALVAGIFGMNLKSYLEEHVFAFWLTTAGIFVGVMIGFFLMYSYLKARKILL